MPHGQADLGELTPRSVFYAQGGFGRCSRRSRRWRPIPSWSRMRSPNSRRPAVLWIPATTCPTLAYGGVSRQLPGRPRLVVVFG